MIELKKLIESGVHFGHQTWRWCPRMKPYIWGEKNGVHLIDVSKTALQMQKAAKFLEEVAAQGKPILWVGTKKAAQQAIEQVGQRLGAPNVTHRWIGGTLTNYPQVKKSVTKLLHLEDVLAKTGEHSYTKKELGLFQKMVARHQKSVGGIRNLTWPVGALVVVDVKKENTAVREALAAGVPVVALVDTNSDPSFVDYVIPANDDIPRAISLILNYLVESVEKGNAQAAERQVEEKVAEDTIEKMLAQALGGEAEDSEGAKRPARSGGGSRKPDAGRGRQPQRRPASSAPRPKPSEVKAPSSDEVSE